jgi:hypothetical protein
MLFPTPFKVKPPLLSLFLKAESMNANFLPTNLPTTISIKLLVVWIQVTQEISFSSKFYGNMIFHFQDSRTET